MRLAVAYTMGQRETNVPIETNPKKLVHWGPFQPGTIVIHPHQLYDTFQVLGQGHNGHLYMSCLNADMPPCTTAQNDGGNEAGLRKLSYFPKSEVPNYD